MMGIQKFIMNQPVTLQMRFEDPDELINLTGTIVNTEAIQGRKDIISAGIVFDKDKIPIRYKIRVNNFLANMKKSLLTPSTSEKPMAEAALPEL